MKKTLLLFLLLINVGVGRAQIAFSNYSTTNITSTSASLNAYVTINCANGGNFHAQFSTTPTFAPNTMATGGSVFSSLARTINISGLTPSTTYYWRYYGNLGSGCNQTLVYSPTQSFTTLPASVAPSISNISIDALNTSAHVNYSLNANGLATTSIVKYGLTDTALTSQQTGGSATGTANTNATAALTGLAPNTTYYYQIEATNSIGTTLSPIGSFITSNPSANIMVAAYNFNNTYLNTVGTNPFSATLGTSFTTDRNGNPNSALNLNNKGAVATIANLSYGNAARTVSVWVRMNIVNANFNFIYCYGNPTNYNGAYFSASNLYHFATGGNHSTSSAATVSWTHYVFVYTGTESRIYRNGLLLNTSNTLAWGTVNNNNFFTIGLTETGGQNYFDGAVDDLKIFNYAVSDADVTSLYTNNSILDNEAFGPAQLQATLYPNPANGHFTVAMTGELKSVEVYSLQGQKVCSANDETVDVSQLSPGVYMVQIEDQNKAVAFKKLIVQ